MSSIVECPVCEEQFFLNVLPNNRVTCPGCQRSFDQSDCLPVDLSLVVAPTARPSPEAQIGFDQPELPVHPVLHQPSIEIATADTPELAVRTRYYGRSKRKAAGFFVGMLLAAVFIGVVSGLLIMQLQKNVDEHNEQVAKAAELLPVDGTMLLPDMTNTANPDRSNPATGKPGSGLSNNSLTPASSKTQPLPKQEFFFFSKKQVDECWQVTRPHLVSLDVENSFGKNRAVGTIIDSRGWILTSYSAIKDAWQIDVTASTTSLADLDQAKPLTDLVKGIVATDPENDLAILAINRRFVVSFADVKVAVSNRIVKGEYLMQGAPPCQEAPYGLNEVKIQQRGGLDDLPQPARSKAEVFQLTSPDITWFSFDSPQPVAPGTPLFQIDGTMVAMASFSLEQQGFAIPVSQLRRLIDSAGGEVQPFSPPVVKTGTGSVLALAADSPARQLTIELNLAGDKCEAFQFFPTQPEQYPDLQEFSRQIIAAYDYVSDSDDPAGIDLVQNNLDLWEEKLQTAVGLMIRREPDRVRAINEFAKTQITTGNRNHVIFYGSMYVGGIQSPKSILKFDGLETFVSVPFDPGAEPMLPDSNWLFFVQTMALARHVDINVADEGVIPTESATLLYAIGPIKNQ